MCVFFLSGCTIKQGVQFCPVLHHEEEEKKDTSQDDHSHSQDGKRSVESHDSILVSIRQYSSLF